MNLNEQAYESNICISNGMSLMSSLYSHSLQAVLINQCSVEYEKESECVVKFQYSCFTS